MTPDSVGNSIAGFEIGLTIFFIFLGGLRIFYRAKGDDFDLFSLFRPSDPVNQQAIRKNPRGRRRPFTGAGRTGDPGAEVSAGGAYADKEHDFARAVAAAAGYIEEDEDITPDLEYAVRKQLRTLSGGDRFFENELWTIFRTCRGDWRVMCRFGRDAAMLTRFFSLISRIMADAYTVTEDKKQRFIEIAAWFGCTEEEAAELLNKGTGRRNSRGAGNRASVGSGMSYDEALRILGVSPLAGDRAVRKAYLRLAQRCHPDKARNRGFSEDVVRVYASKFRTVTDAWNVVRKERGI